ncbi:MAG: hypothetical protein ACREO3_05175 [Arenimonas sp.]
MPFAIGLSYIIAIFFASHAIRSGQDKYWLWILFGFPGIGSLVYAITIWLPEARHSHGGRQVVRGAQRLLDPSRELREAQEQLDIAATADNRLRLAEALLNYGRPSEAVVQYQAALVGVHAGDPGIRVRLAHALLDAGHPQAARAELEVLIVEQPGFKSPEGHLVFARALAALDERAKAREEFEVLVGYYACLEARARFAQALLAWGDGPRLRDLLGEGQKIIKRMPGAARDINREWIDVLKAVEKNPV